MVVAVVAGAGAAAAAAVLPTVVEIPATRNPVGPPRTACARGRRPAGAGQPPPLSYLPREDEEGGAPQDVVPVVVGGGVEVGGVVGGAAAGSLRVGGGIGTGEEGGGVGEEGEGGGVGAGGGD